MREDRRSEEKKREKQREGELGISEKIKLNYDFLNDTNTIHLPYI